MAEVILTGGQAVTVDDEDLAAVATHRWYLSHKGPKARPVRSMRTPQGWVDFPMVRELLPELGRHARIRYVDGNPLNLRRENLLLPSSGRAPQTGPKPMPISRLAKGVVAELDVAADLFRHGFEVFFPAHGFSRWDMIAIDAAGRTARVQVKSATPKEQRLIFNLHNVSTNADGIRMRPLPAEMIDLLALYDSAHRQVGYIHPSTARGRNRVTTFTHGRDQARRAFKAGRLPEGLLCMPELSDPHRALALQNSPEAAA